MKSLQDAYAGKRVFVTGHTGFKASWLCEWLLGLGAEVWGYSLPPPTRPALFDLLGLKGRLHHRAGDVRDAAALSRAVADTRPDFLFHLAAQPIVRRAHQDPAETWSTNVMGTVNLLEALRANGRSCAAVVVTTDKVYGGTGRAHAEGDPLGASGLYGASKAAAELAVDAWRQSFFPVGGRRRGPKVAVATARSGNVIGGGDWSDDRLVPDCMRALRRGSSIVVRHPSAVRPWQHVLDPLLGYLMLGAQLAEAQAAGSAGRLCELSGAFNFGPGPGCQRTVKQVVEEILRHWPGSWKASADPGGIVETAVLRLRAAKARRVLGWRPAWGFSRSVRETVAWYRAARTPAAALAATRGQIARHTGGGA